MKEKLSIVIPTYNEKDNITPLIERIHKALSAYSYEIVLVDDNSKDGTIEIASALASRYPVSCSCAAMKKAWPPPWSTVSKTPPLTLYVLWTRTCSTRRKSSRTL